MASATMGDDWLGWSEGSDDSKAGGDWSGGASLAGSDSATPMSEVGGGAIALPDWSVDSRQPRER